MNNQTETSTTLPVETLPPELADQDAFERYRETGKLPEPQQPEPTPVEAKADTPAAPAEPEATTAADSETAEPATEQKKPEAKEAKKGGFQRKIDKLTRENYALAGKIDELEARLAGKAGKAEPDETPAGETAPDGTDKYGLRVADFETYEKYLDRRDEVAAEHRNREEAERTAHSKFIERATEAKSAYPDFEEVTHTDEVMLTPVMQHIVTTSEKGPDLVYHLCKNPEVAERIADLEPAAQIYELAKLEATLTRPSKEAPKEAAAPKPKAKTTAAPAPVSTVGGTSGGAINLDDPETPYEEWERRRNAQLLERRAA